MADDKIKQMIHDGASEHEMKAYVNKNTTSLASDGFARILEGVTIQDGAIIAAGSIIRKDIEAYSIYSGNPQTFIRYRFPKDIREKLLRIKWWEKPAEWLEKNALLFKDINFFLNEYNDNYI